ncbi:MAG: Uma2 family endonuclease [Bacteroidota bacterium]
MAEYHAMIDAGILTSEDKVELLFGQIIEMSPVGKAHSTTVKKITGHLYGRFVAPDFIIGVQDPITLVDDSEPEPDIYVANGPLEKYLEHHPYPEDLLLVIEVSDTTLAKDKGGKKIGYAVAGISEYWVVDVYGEKIYRYTDPDAAQKTYQKEEIYSEEDTIKSVFLGTFAVKDLLVKYP